MIGEADQSYEDLQASIRSSLPSSFDHWGRLPTQSYHKKPLAGYRVQKWEPFEGKVANRINSLG